MNAFTLSFMLGSIVKATVIASTEQTLRDLPVAADEPSIPPLLLWHFLKWLSNVFIAATE